MLKTAFHRGALLCALCLAPAAYGAAPAEPAQPFWSQEAWQLARDNRDLSPEEKALLQKRLEQWRNMPQEEREQIRRQRQDFERLSPDEQQRLREEFRSRHPGRGRG
ncbi:MAG: DUF3106 domain-containing protein [Pseudomonadota bacterium]|uniref:DUF3106 domain-containing protein n=1 Tax=Thermithiobacillus tepidarius TaxID=929 RepID=UPI00041B8F35|nr:DUF3106 domain-containing protein [Thermithiobacillus tepidarius]